MSAIEEEERGESIFQDLFPQGHPGRVTVPAILVCFHLYTNSDARINTVKGVFIDVNYVFSTTLPYQPPAYLHFSPYA